VRLAANLLIGFSVLLSAGVAQGDDCTFLLPKGFPVDEYAAIVTHYRNGQFTTAGTRLQALAPQRVDEVLEFLRENGWAERCFFAASLLHTEMGMRGETVFVRPDDPEHHFASAWKLTGFVPAEGSKERFQRNWLLLMGLFYQKMIFDPEVVRQTEPERLTDARLELLRGAHTYFNDAVEAFPRDPEILLAAGTLFEWAGAPHFGEPRHLAKAEKLYERACRLDPNDALAQLRYGTTLWKRRQSEKSATALRRALELSKDDELIFRAHIALGRIAVLEGNHQEAISLFRSAREAKPEWQVGSLALSHALHAAGARDESRRELERGLSIPRTDENLFGWWSWETGLIERFMPLLESMRNEVLF